MSSWPDAQIGRFAEHRRHPFHLLGMRGVHEDQARHVGAVVLGVGHDIGPAERVAHQDVRGLLAAGGQQGVEIVGGRHGVMRPRRRLAPDDPGPVVGASPGIQRDRVLDQAPADHAADIEAGFEHHRGRSGPAAEEMHFSAADIHHRAGRRILGHRIPPRHRDCMTKSP